MRRGLKTFLKLCVPAALLFSKLAACKTTDDTSGLQSNDYAPTVDVRGEHDGYKYTARINPRVSAEMIWDDGNPGFTARYDQNPERQPRCLCESYTFVDAQGTIRQIDYAPQTKDVFFSKYPQSSPTAGTTVDVRGQFDNHAFTARIKSRVSAQMIWDDGAAGFTGTYNPNPERQSRCICESYTHVDAQGVIRQIDYELATKTAYFSKYPQTQGNNQATFDVRGVSEGYKFTARINTRVSAQMIWDDGAAGFTARYTQSPERQPRCICESYTHVDAQGMIRQIDYEPATKTAYYSKYPRGQ